VAAQQLQRSTSMLEQLQAALKADPGNRALESRIKDLRAEVDTLSKSASSAATGLHNLVGQQLDLGQTDPRELARRGRGGAAFGQASLPDLFGKGASGTAPKSAQPDLTIPQQLQDALKALDGTDVEKISRLRAELLQLVSLKSSGSQDARLDEAIATATAELEKLNPATQQAIAQQKQLVDLLAATPSAQLQATQADMQLLAAALERGAISAAQFEEAVNVRLGNTAPAIEKTKSLADELGLSFSSAFEDAVAKGDSFGGMLKAIEQDLIRIAARKFVTEPALNYLGSLFSGGGSGGSWLTTITALFGGGKAVGGSVDAGKFYRVNESGSELLTMGGKDYLMMGSRSGRITPNSKLGGGGSAMHFDFSGQTIQVGAGVSMAQVASAVKAGNQATESHIRRLMREGAMA